MHKLLKDVDNDKVFYLKNGKVIKNLKELLNEAKRMSADDFDHHVSKERNDFSNWIIHVLKNESLADKISPIKNKKELVSVLGDAIMIAQKGKLTSNNQNDQKSGKIMKAENTETAKKTARKKPKLVKSKTITMSKKTNKNKPAKKPDKSREIVKVKKEASSNKKAIGKVDEILRREEKILEIEHLLEEKMEEGKSKKRYKIEEFVQGLLLGVIVGFIIGLLLITL